MATRLMRLAIETQVQLGLVDTIGERILFQIVHKTNRIVKTPKRLCASFLIVLIVAKSATSSPLLDTVSKQMTTLLDTMKEINNSTASQLLNQKKELASWAASLRSNYQEILSSQTRFDSASTFHLKDDITKISVSPEMMLTSGASNDGEYESFRQRSRYDEPDKSKTYADIFNNTLNNVDEKTFDTIQRFRYEALANNKIDREILNGEADNAAKAVKEKWDNLLNNQKDSSKFESSVKNAGSNLAKRILSEEKNFADLIATSGANEKEKEIAKKLMSNRNSVLERSLTLRVEEINNAKKNNEINQSGVTYLAESTKIQAQVQSIINGVQKKAYDIMVADNGGTQNSVDADEGKLEAFAAKLVSKLDLSGTDSDSNLQVDLSKMKLRPSAEAEINRMMAMASIAINQQQMQLLDLQERNRQIKAMDDVGKAHFDAQNNLLRSFPAVDDKLYDYKKQSQDALDEYFNSKELTKSDDKKTSPKSIADTHDAYFKVIKKYDSLNLFKALFEAYVKFFQKFFFGTSLRDSMKNAAADVEKENLRNKDMLDVYDNGKSNV